MASPPTANTVSRRLLRHAPAVLIGISVCLCIALSICYAVRPDACAAVTVWPPWVWGVPGLMLLLLVSRRASRRLVVCVAVLWTAYLLVFNEEPRSLLRFGGMSQAEFEEARRRGEVVRVVSVNCGGGSAAAAEEVERYRPDIVLLQESPGRKEVEELADRLFGPEAGVAWGMDTSIIARARLDPPPPGLPPHFIQARFRSPTAFEADIFSIRLCPPIVRADLWSPGSWRSHRSNRQFRRREMEQIAQRLGVVPERTPVILGGDFNAPAGDAIFRPLRPRLHDAFGEGGRGVGNTVLNDFPVLRFDQIWVSEHSRAARVRAEKSYHSDHRLIVCDLVVTQSPVPVWRREE